MSKLFLDIETIPSQQPGIMRELSLSLKIPANYNNAQTIERWREDSLQKAYLKTSLDGAYGQMVCIGYAIDEQPAQVMLVPDLSLVGEQALLIAFFRVYEEAGVGSLLIGHNHIGFDLPFILKRAIVQRVTPPPFFPRNPRWNGNDLYDTMLAWSNKDFISMDRLCAILGIAGKGAIDGSDVWPMVQAGKLPEVGQYCQGDVERTRQIFQRLTFNQL
jgi:predicted PolB exonuclease-like 3'-5' exonuclease